MITNELLTALAEGRLTFGQFERQTRGDFQAMATGMARKWGALPDTLQVEDLVQVMLLAVHLTVPNHDAKLGEIAPYVVHRAYCAARKELNRCHNSEDRDDRMGVSDDVQPPIQEHVHLARERCAQLPCDDRQRTILESLIRTGSFDLTTTELLSHADTRSMFNTPDPVRARHSVYRTAIKLARRAQAI